MNCTDCICMFCFCRVGSFQIITGCKYCDQCAGGPIKSCNEFKNMKEGAGK